MRNAVSPVRGGCIRTRSELPRRPPKRGGQKIEAMVTNRSETTRNGKMGSSETCLSCWFGIGVPQDGDAGDGYRVGRLFQGVVLHERGEQRLVFRDRGEELINNLLQDLVQRLQRILRLVDGTESGE